MCTHAIPVEGQVGLSIATSLKLDKEKYYEAILWPAAKQSKHEKWTHEAIKLCNWAESPDTDIACLAGDWVSSLMSLMVGMRQALV